MNDRKTVLILTDESAPVISLAKEISEALGESIVNLKTAENFTGTDLLPAQIFFIGCEKPGPPSFGYIEKLLTHINLAGRICGIFCAGDKAAAGYLSELLKDCEAAVSTAPQTGKISLWAKSLVN